MKVNSSVGGLAIVLCITVHATYFALGRTRSGPCSGTCWKFCNKGELAARPNTTGDLSVAIRSMCSRTCQPRAPIGQLGNENGSNTLGKCTATGSCIPHSHCFEGHCRCDIGYDLHRKLGKCRILTECEHFGNHISSFEHQCILLHDMRLIKHITRGKCIAECMEYTLCQTADHMNALIFKNYCYLQNVTWYGVGTNSQMDFDACVHFQRSCIW